MREMLGYIDANKTFVTAFLREHLPFVKVTELEGTYLLWLDFRALGLSKQELEELMRKKAYLFLDEGYIFGRGGEGFERLNLACPAPCARRRSRAIGESGPRNIPRIKTVGTTASCRYVSDDRKSFGKRLQFEYAVITAGGNDEKNDKNSVIPYNRSVDFAFDGILHFFGGFTEIIRRQHGRRHRGF